MACNIQRISSSDIQIFRNMLAVFGEAFEDVKTYCDRQPGDPYLEEMLESETFFALAALEERTVVGGLVAYELKKFEQERSEFYIYDLAVKQSHRRRGIATGLIEILKDIAARRAADVIFVQADLGDEPAIALYTKLGICEDVLHFDISTGDRAT
ncbi:MAG: AAC(3)-I family aminoglycoside N-acetyltransferase [Stappiaceae bacterium]